MSLLPEGSYGCQEMFLLSVLKMGESLQGEAFCLGLGFISRTLGEGRNLLLAGVDLEFPGLDKGLWRAGVWQEVQDFPY